MPPPLFMGSQPWPVLLTAVLLLSLVPASAQPNQEEANAGALLDVMVLSASCLSNESCEADRPAHLIEYFSADWCEPCQQVSEQLRMLTEIGLAELKETKTAISNSMRWSAIKN